MSFKDDLKEELKKQKEVANVEFKVIGVKIKDDYLKDLNKGIKVDFYSRDLFYRERGDSAKALLEIIDKNGK